ncbi:MAG TPA: ribonuclease H [Propionibacteriaceae bacterium]|nr:ribonuclease H [Propionibacteriaceae bacterium]
MIIAAADGSSLSNPGPAGWAWFVDEDRWAAGGWAHGTNNMGELMAVLDLLRQTRASDEDLRVLCDSQYAINCCTTWRFGWKRRGWRKADGSPVLNVDLVKELDKELTGRAVEFEWVKGHNGHSLNERADDLARAAATAFQQGTAVAHGPGFVAGSAPAVSMAVRPTRREPEPDLFSAAEPTPAPRPSGRWPAPEEDAEAVVVALERSLLTDEVLLDHDRLSSLLHPDYVAYEPGGAIRTRGSALARAVALPGAVELAVLGADRLAPDVLLLRYRLRRAGEETLCASVWQYDGSTWRRRFHQATV